jgi:hypothetical protein
MWLGRSATTSVKLRGADAVVPWIVSDALWELIEPRFADSSPDGFEDRWPAGCGMSSRSDVADSLRA